MSRSENEGELQEWFTFADRFWRMVEKSKKDGTSSLLLPLGNSSRFNLVMSTMLTLLHAQQAGLCH